MIERFAHSLLRYLSAYCWSAFLLLVGVAGLSAQTTAVGGASTGPLANATYRLEPLSNGAVRVHAGPVHADFAPAFTVLLRHDDPQFAVRPNRVNGVGYSVETWFTGADETAVSDSMNTMVGDGFDPRILKGDQKGRVSDVFRAGERVTLTGTASAVGDGGIKWSFDGDGRFALSATLSLPVAGEPVLRVNFVPRADGWYSVGYTGAPAVAPAAAEEFFQSPFWTRKRFPARSYLTTHRTTLPGTLVGAQRRVVGVLADPSLVPFQPLPVFTNFPFGVTVRNAEGQAQPIVFCPTLGGAGSRRKSGETVSFDLRLFVRQGDIDSSYEYLARDLMRVRDFRHNDLCSINTTIDNIIEYALSPFSLFDEALRGSSYETDLPNSVNNVTGLHPLSLAVIFDREDIYRRRALPMIEAGLSRTKRLFASDPKVGSHSDWTLKGPNMVGSELAALAAFSHGRAAALLDIAKRDTRGDGVARNLELYRATNDGAYLRKAMSLADSQIAAMPAKESELRISGWNLRTPWVVFTELHELTGERRYLDAAVYGAREFTKFLWLGPLVPEGDGQILVNPGGRAPLYWYMASKGKQPIPATEGTMPAWRSSEIGLTTEAPGTSTGHRGVFLATPAVWLFRLGQRADQPLFRDLARNALVGRSRNFPGYHLNTERTDVHEQTGFPLRPSKELSYNSFHYNHVWPHVAMLFDFLVTDVEGLSGRRVLFPGHYVEAYSYLTSRVYGAEPGRFYDQSEAWLWMPRGLVQTDNVEINWLAARSAGGLCLALTNQSHQPQRFTVKLDPRRLAGLEKNVRVVRWKGGEAADELSAADGVLSLEVGPRELVALRFPGVQARTEFQDRMVAGKPAPAGGSVAFDFGGTGAAHLISMGTGLSTGYAFLRAEPGVYREVRLEVRNGATWTSHEDSAYPHEFSVPLPDGAPFTFRFLTRNPAGKTERSPEYSVPAVSIPKL
jgi:hypothetical protein